MNEKMEEIGNAISEEELESDEMVTHIQTHVQKISDMENLDISKQSKDDEAEESSVDKPQ